MHYVGRLVHSVVASSFNEHGQPKWGFASIVISMALVQALILFLASHHDGTLFMPARDDGFLEHYGVWAILITDPLLILSAGYAYKRFLGALDSLPLTTEKNKLVDPSLVFKPYLDFLQMKSWAVYAYLGLVLVGILTWINNIWQTINPNDTYGNDVFDAHAHWWGFVANKANLFGSWVLVYPIVIFYLVSMTFCLRLVLMRLIRSNSVAPNVLHPDECYGLRQVGLLNVSLVFPYVLIYGVAYALIYTHEEFYWALKLALIGITACVLFASFFTIGPITSLGRRVKEQTFEKLEKKNRTYLGNEKRVENRHAFERICFATARASPYSKGAQTAISVLRLGPIASTVYRFLLP